MKKAFEFGAIKIIRGEVCNSLKLLLVSYNKVSEELNRNAMR